MEKVIVVGATSGIGREVALRLAQTGCKVGITGRRSELLHEIAAQYPQNFTAMPFDATAADATNKLASLIGGMGGIDTLIFCAGVGELNPELDYGTEYASNRLNVEAFTRFIDFTYNYFRQCGSGRIAVVTSVMGLRGSDAAPSYSASKAYQINYLEGLRRRARKNGENITVTDLRPGSVRTDMMKGEGHFWIAEPRQAAETIVEAVEKKRRVRYITPRWSLIAMLLKIIPGAIYERM